MSKFGSLIAERRHTPATSKSHNAKMSEVQQPEMVKRGPGRPRAKRSDPAYTQITVYVRKDTHVAAKKLLLDIDKEFSELVEELVAAWVAKRQGKPAS